MSGKKVVLTLHYKYPLYLMFMTTNPLTLSNFLLLVMSASAHGFLINHLIIYPPIFNGDLLVAVSLQSNQNNLKVSL